MSFNRLDYLPYILGALIVFLIFHFKQNYTFFMWVRRHWFFKQSLWSRVASIFYALGISLLLVSLLDLRGKEKKIKSNVPDQKTIILIDSSSSMLVEDVRPNRFQKALLLARHFIKQAAGQQISIILFSDFQKTYVPFTTDVDLLDARIASLSNLNITKGGSNLSQAIQESIQYFQESAGDVKDFSGNILIFSDAEETIDGFDLKIPDGISVGIVGVGTARGGPIPLRDSRNIFYGNKQFEGQEVNSKLDEGFLKLLGTKVKNYKYWIATSFALPTDEIIRFFTQLHNKRFSQGDVKIRPVKAEWILLPALILFSLAMFFKLQRSFTYLFLFCFLSFSTDSFAQDEEEGVPPLNEEEKALVAKIAKGEASAEEKLTLAESFLKTKKVDSAITLYEETLNNNLKPDYLKSYMNLGTALLKMEEIDRGLKIYSDLAERLKKNLTEENQKLLKAMQANTLLVFKNQEDQKKQKQDKDKNQQNQQNQQKQDKDKNQDNKDKKEQQNQDKKQDQKDQRGNEKDKQDQKNKEKEKSKDKDKENKEQDKGKEKEDKKNQDGEDDQEEQREQPKPEKKLKVKLPAQLKQLMSDDRALQEQILDTSTHEAGKPRKAKDW